MHRALALVLISTLTTAGCVVHSSPRVADPEQFLRTKCGPVRVVARDGQMTSWMPSEALAVVDNALCVRSAERPWKRVDAIRISQLTDGNIAAILAGLPPSVGVAHRGSGEIELATGGADLAAWLSSRAHDPSDVAPRYLVQSWEVWRGPLTWRQLASAGRPLLGWSLADATVERRKVNVPGTIALSALAVAAIAVIAVIEIAARSTPRRRDTPDQSLSLRHTETAIALISLGNAAANELPPGTWLPRPCFPIADPPPLPAERVARITGTGPVPPPRGAIERTLRRLPGRHVAHTFWRGKSASVRVPAQTIVFGAEGVCFPTKRRMIELWEALRVSGVDPRMVDRVVQPLEGITLIEAEPRVWEVHGTSAALAAWIAQHRRAVAIVQRELVDLPALAYSVRTQHGWFASDEDALRGELRDRPWAELPASALVGWRWSDLTGVTTMRNLRVQNNDDLDVNDELVQDAILTGAPLAPGSCPLSGPMWPLIPRA